MKIPARLARTSSLPARTALAAASEVEATTRPLTPEESEEAERLYFAGPTTHRRPFPPVVLGDVPADRPDPVGQLAAELDATRAQLLPRIPRPPAGAVLDYVPAGLRPLSGPVAPLIFDALAVEVGGVPFGSVGD